jgi:hypothetical protein
VLCVLVLSAHRGAKGSKGSGEGYRSETSTIGGGFRLMRLGTKGALRSGLDIVVAIEGDSGRRREQRGEEKGGLSASADVLHRL